MPWPKKGITVTAVEKPENDLDPKEREGVNAAWA